MTRKKLIARLDKVFSQWVRSKDADHRGFRAMFYLRGVEAMEDGRRRSLPIPREVLDPVG